MQVRFPQGSFYSQNSRKLAKCIKMPLKRKKTPQNGNKHPKIGKVAPPGRNTPQKHETCPNNAQNTISYSPSCHMSASKSRKITHQTESNTPKTDRDSSAVLCVQTSTLKPDIQVQIEIGKLPRVQQLYPPQWDLQLTAVVPTWPSCSWGSASKCTKTMLNAS